MGLGRSVSAGVVAVKTPVQAPHDRRGCGCLVVVRRTSTPERLSLAVGQRPPEPLGGPKAKCAQPEWRDDELDRPNTQHDAKLPHSLDVAEPAEPVSVEEQRADHRLKQVVREGHLPDRG